MTCLFRRLTLALALLLAGTGCPPPVQVVRPDEWKIDVPGATALVVVYSRSGNTAQMARSFATVLGADYVRLQATSGAPGSYLSVPSWTSQVPIAPEKIDLAPYGLVLVGGPIWQWRPNAVSASFLQANDFTGKAVVLFYTFQGGKMSPETEAQWRKMVTDRGGRVVEVLGIDRTALPEGKTVADEAERLARERDAAWRKPEM
jgi:flavodoxin